VEGGGTLLAGPYLGAVDEHDHVRLARFDSLLGHRLIEYRPLPDHHTVALSGGLTGRIWTEARAVASDDVEIRATFEDGPAAGSPAFTRHGGAWWLGTRLDDDSLESVLLQVLAEAGADLYPGPGLTGVERVIRRSAEGRTYLFLLNHGDNAATVDTSGVDLLTGAPFTGTLPAHGVAVIRQGTGGERSAASGPTRTEE
jgi:beta-galactosidase